jgi:O-antigen ligase
MAPRSRAQPTGRSLWVLVFAILLLVVISVVPWRLGTIYSGGADPVVVAKAVVGIAAFCGALLLHTVIPVRGRVGVRTLSLLAGIVVISMVGAFAANDGPAALVLSIRIVLVSASVVLVVKSAPPVVVLTALLTALGAVALVSAATGAAHGLTDGRLSGGIPAMASNVLAGLAGPPAVGLATMIARRGIRAWTSVTFLVLFAIVFATGSRTALVVVIVGVILALVFNGRRLPLSTAIMTIVALPLAYALLAFTNTATQVLSRGQSIQELSTLSSRTVAWDAVLAVPIDSWAKWIGNGLAAKTVAVQQRWRDVQVLDSSWVSVIAQAGIIGTILLVIWIVVTSVESLRRSPLRAIAVPLLVMLLIRSFTESGLIDSSPTFLVFLALSLILEPGSSSPGPGTGLRPYRLAEPLPIDRGREPAVESGGGLDSAAVHP